MSRGFHCSSFSSDPSLSNIRQVSPEKPDSVPNALRTDECLSSMSSIHVFHNCNIFLHSFTINYQFLSVGGTKGGEGERGTEGERDGEGDGEGGGGRGE